MNRPPEDSQAIAIPAWFRWINGGVMVVVLTGGVPWATWVSYTLITIQQKVIIVDSVSARVLELDRQIEMHSSQFRVNDATRFTADQGRLIQSSVDRLETKIESVGRDVSDLRSRPPSRQGERTGQPPAPQP